MPSSILAIASDAASDAALLDDLAGREAERVTVLLLASGFAADRWAEGDGPRERALRDRLAALLTGAAVGTGAAVVGLVGDTASIAHLGFDETLRARPRELAAVA